MERISLLAGKPLQSSPFLTNVFKVIPSDAQIGQINRAKNQQAGVTLPAPQVGPSRSTSGTRHHRGGSPIDVVHKQSAHGRGGYYRGHAPYPTSARGGYRGANGHVHRHRSLVLNNTPGANNSNGDTASPSDSTSPSWVTRNDRHLQLINSNIFQEQTEARAKAIQQTRLQKHRQKDARERAQFMSHLKQTTNPSVVSANPASAPAYEIVVEGIRFRVTNDGSKLVKIPGAYPSSLNPCTYR